MANLLVEIGVEELPLVSLDIIYSELANKASSALEKKRLAFRKIKVEATPRRIALFVEGLSAKQSDEALEIKGPMEEKAFDSAGRPTKALEGFLKSKNAQISEIILKELPKGKAVYLHQKSKGRPTIMVLPEILTEVFLSLSFPKLMRWEASGFKFPRPIRWVVALLDKEVLSQFQLADVKAGKQSYGHRFLSPKAFTILSANWKTYLAMLKKAHVLLEIEKRENKVRGDLAKLFNQKNADEDLVHLSAQLVEEPFLLLGDFKKEYLDLPAEVLATCMKKHQKIFAYYGVKGKLQNKFIAVLNGKRKGLARIELDYENVLESRLHDARYFYNEDLKTSLEAHHESLGQLMYLGDLGSMKDKIGRMLEVASFFAKQTQNENLEKDLKRVVTLSKTDLMTALVYEFPELQGIAGREYAKRVGENKEVAKALGMQYLPKNLFEDYKNLKKSLSVLGVLFGILDRLDLLVGAFAIGLEPTGSQDPYALRRAAGSIVKLIRAHQIHFSLSGMIQKLRREYEKVGLNDKEAAETAEHIEKRMKGFLKDRVLFELKLKAGSREYEIFDAVWQSNADDLADVYDRLESLIVLYKKSEEVFVRAGKVIERTHNITKTVKSNISEIKQELLEAPEERVLFDLLRANSARISKKIDERAFAEATRIFSETFYEPVNSFFDQVMVNVEDMRIRENRQALMKSINGLYTSRLADLSVLSRFDK